MKRHVSAAALLVLVGWLVMPASAAELRVTGFFDNYMTLDQNISSVDNDVTSNKDNAFFGNSRSRFFFNFIASDNLRGVFGMELDSIIGAPSRDRMGSRCITPEQCGFRNGIDTNNFELKQLYADFRIPQLPFGNRIRLGGTPTNITPLHPHLIYTMDSGGLDVTLNFTDKVSLLLTYVQLEEDVERFPSSVKIGEDFLTGGNLMLKPLPGLDFHLLGVYGHMQAPFGPALTGRGGPFFGIQGLETNVTTEDRFYVGFDSRYRLGNLRIEPSFFYLFGTRKFCSPGQRTGHGRSGRVTNDIGGPTIDVLRGCTSPTAGQEADLSAFAARFVVQYTMGKWLFAGRFAYASGDKADADINNQPGPGTRPHDVKGWRPLGLDGFNRLSEWLNVLGRGELLASLAQQTPYRAGEAGRLDRFGWMTTAGRVDYKLTERLTLQGLIGAAWAAETPACPAVLRTRAPTAANPTGCRSSNFNFTGNSKYLGTEIDLHLQYTIMPGLTYRVGGGYGWLGDGFQIENRNVQDAWLFINRVLYVF